MTMASFTLHRPRSLDEALQILEEHAGDARIVAGGSDLVVNMRMRIQTPAQVVDLRGIDELRGFRFDAEEGLSVGALTTVSALANDSLIKERFSVVASAARQLAGPNIRNMATVGGNLCLDTRCVYYNQSYFWRKSNNFCLKKDGSVCHVAPGGKKCWAVASGDLAPAFLALNASVRLVSPQGERTLPLSEFYINDGIEKYDLRPDEILCEVIVPAEYADWRGRYEKYRVRDSIDYPLASAAVALKVDEAGICADARIAVTAVNPSPRVVEGIGELLTGKSVTPDLLEQAANLVRRTAKPMRTTVVATSTYRRHIVGVLAKRGLARLLSNPSGQAGGDPAAAAALQ